MGCCFSEPVDFTGEVNLFHFDLHRAVGKGAFGKVCHGIDVFLLQALLTFHPSHQVRVVEHKRSKKLYALKYIDKTRCIRQKAIANIIQERRLLEEVRHLPTYAIIPNLTPPVMLHRLTTLLLSTSVTHFRTILIVFSYSTSCWEVTYDVCGLLSHLVHRILILYCTVHLDRRAHIPEDVVMFWIAELSCALEYLHRQRIIHRCVNPLFVDHHRLTISVET